MKAAIVAGGRVEDAFVCAYLDREAYDLVIAVDRGLEFFYRSHRRPDHVTGDFDSVDEAVLQFFRQQAAAEQKPQFPALNPQKDDTDTEHALRMALEQGCETVHLFGATGSRLDHVLGNLQLLGLGLRAGAECVMLDCCNRIRLIDKEICLKKQEQFGAYVSLIPYTPRVTGLTLEGFAYPLNRHTMSSFYLPQAAQVSGISNEIVAETARIAFEDGILVLIESKDETG